jgi:hypothetical protein
MKEEDTSIEVFSGTSWEAGMIKSLLENAEINSFLKNDMLNSHLYDPIMADGVKVIVMKSDYVRAMEVVEGYRNKE